ncbi:MAG: FHA domain-containing serine/threonine-protein kinase [Planctomycetales bacterium]
MSATRVAEDFLALLARSELLPAPTIAAAIARYEARGLSTPEQLSRAFVAEGLLTSFQAERLLGGRYRGFFLGGYQVEELLGSGGMGCIYIAREVATGRRVALKVLSESVKQDTGILARFELEARAGMRLNDPHIVRTLETGETGQVRYMVMEFVEALNVHEISVLSGPIPWDQACDFICQAAAGLEHAHRRGLVHRDVKPSNLLVDHDGRVKILDFGLALLDGQEDADEFSLAMIFGHDCLGTADYMAPEQALDSYNVDARADIYSLGATLYFAITGKVPYPVEQPAEKIEAHRRQPPPDPRRAVPGVPAQVAAAIAKMMAKRPEDRYPDVSAVRAALCPLARRKPLVFDFRRILDIRAADTRRRVVRERDSRKMSDLAAGSTACGSDRSRGSGPPSSSGRRAGARQETLVGAGDTRASRSSISLDDPFDSSRPSGSHVPISAVQAGDIVEQFTIPVSGYRLVPVEGGMPIPLEKPRLLLGRLPECDVILPYSAVSGRHCELRYVGEAWHVVDLGSKNGVHIDGRKVQPEAPLPVGGVLTIGKVHSFRIERADDPGGAAEAGRDRAARGRTRTWIIALTAAAVGALALAAWLL